MLTNSFDIILGVYADPTILQDILPSIFYLGEDKKLYYTGCMLSIVMPKLKS